MSKSLKQSTKNIPRGTTVMVIDEFGDLGVTPKDPTKKRRCRYFGYAVSVTDKPKKFAALTDNNRRVRRKELKASLDSLEGRKKIAEGVGDMNVDVRVYYVDKDNPPRGWSGKKGSSEDMEKLFHHSVKDSLPEKGNVLVVVDRHSGHKNVEKFLKEQSKDELKVKGNTYDSASGPYSELLQTHDYVAYAATDVVEYKNRDLSDIMGMKLCKITRRL